MYVTERSGASDGKKFAIVAQCVFRSRQGHQLLRPLSNNTKESSQCVNCLIFTHTVTTALSDCLVNHFPWQLYSHKSYSVISYYSSIQQGVDTHPCLVTIYRLFTDTGQEVSAPNVSTHNRHQLSHQLSVVIASTIHITSSISLVYKCRLNGASLSVLKNCFIDIFFIFIHFFPKIIFT